VCSTHKHQRHFYSRHRTTMLCLSLAETIFFPLHACILFHLVNNKLTCCSTAVGDLSTQFMNLGIFIGWLSRAPLHSLTRISLFSARKSCARRAGGRCWCCGGSRRGRQRHAGRPRTTESRRAPGTSCSTCPCPLSRRPNLSPRRGPPADRACPTTRSDSRRILQILRSLDCT
jgi:hypothetical protein